MNACADSPTPGRIAGTPPRPRLRAVDTTDRSLVAMDTAADIVCVAVESGGVHGVLTLTDGTHTTCQSLKHPRYVLDRLRALLTPNLEDAC